ncbi:hypothetical protein BO99DRAFT_111195 [Aspergillus violaceofuscus CBS 115571]|uniref:Uncharacterized protein n=1 Tax=Aspergillus violaceofuscus (strain CBS 115571) TaxID=1450538 RepID=A0A2V5IKW7_ASPV1|nr:hypothetical protein BO99DRAFT_111195 [Aspergillus violaceofuscus CBS 115571]
MNFRCCSSCAVHRLRPSISSLGVCTERAPVSREAEVTETHSQNTAKRRSRFQPCQVPSDAARCRSGLLLGQHFARMLHQFARFGEFPPCLASQKVWFCHVRQKETGDTIRTAPLSGFPDPRGFGVGRIDTGNKTSKSPVDGGLVQSGWVLTLLTDMELAAVCGYFLFFF